VLLWTHFPQALASPSQSTCEVESLGGEGGEQPFREAYRGCGAASRDRLSNAHRFDSGQYVVDPARPQLQDAGVQQTQVCNITEKSLNFGNTQCSWMGAVNAKMVCLTL